jgi:hypothetical protein
MNFPCENNLRLVVKGGDHSYQRTPNAAGSLLICRWAMKAGRPNLFGTPKPNAWISVLPFHSVFGQNTQCRHPAGQA